MSESKRPRWLRYLRFWGTNVDADIDDELRYHLELRVEDFVKRGMSAADARAAALQSFGNPVEIASELREHDLAQLQRERRADVFQDLMQDIRYGFRQLRSAPRFTSAAIIVLALGIGANTAIFSAIDAAFLKPLPFKAPEQLVSLSTSPPFAASGMEVRKSEPDLLDHRADTAAFASVAAYATGGLNLAGGAEPIRATVTYATNQFFETFGRAPLVGRVPVAEEYAKGGPRTVVLSHATWQRLFGGDRGVVGRTVTLNDKPYRIVGVMPADFRFPDNTDAWVTLDIPYGFDVMEAFRNFLPVTGIARLREGVTVHVAAQHLDEIRRRFKPTLDTDDTPVEQLARPLHSALVGGDRKTALIVLMASAALLLLIACANVTNLLLARSAARQREIAVRAVLGATRERIVRQLVVEHLMLALAAAVVALIVARLSLGALSAVVPPTIAGVAPPNIDARVLVFTALIALATSLLVGVLPALGASRLDLGDAMKLSGAGKNASQRRGRARSMLVVAEVSLALMLVVGAGLMIESLRLLLDTDVGINTTNVASARLVLARAKYNTVERRGGFYADVLQRLRAVPGIQSAGAVNALPLDAAGTISLRIAAEDGPQDEEHGHNAVMLSASGGYFRTLGVPLTGDDLPDVRDTSRRVAVINRTLAQTLWPGKNPIGRRFGWANMQHTVIGVVGDIRTRSLERAPVGQMYTPIVDGPQSYGAIVVRGSGDVSHLLADLRNAVRAVDPTQPVYEMRAMEDVVGQSVAPRRTNTVLLGTFGVLAMVLAAVGVYAVLSYGVAQRTREIGVRMALGAKREDVIALIAREGLVLAAIGIVIGLAGAFALSKTMSSMLFAVNPRDARIFAVAPMTLAIVAVVATLAPALRATRVDPMAALRAE